MKGFKVTDSKRSRIVGVAASNLAYLLAKAQEKLGLKDDKLLVALDDGTLIEDDDYFSTLPAQTLLIFYRSFEPIITGVDIILSALKRVNATYLNVSVEAVEAMQDKAHELSTLLNTLPVISPPRGNTRDADPEWFEGLETNAKTKEDFMYKKSQDRIRGYLYKFQDDIKKSQSYKSFEQRKIFTDLLDTFKKRLTEDGYFGCYFDRRCAAHDEIDSGSKKKKPKIVFEMSNGVLDKNCDRKSYCDENGLFLCEGIWKMKHCIYSTEHTINPYLNKESRVIFSTWNLDHRIEKSRTILPALLAAVEDKKDNEILNVMYFYRLLFTRSNLKLVHIVCHDKAVHDVSCDHRLVTLSV